MTHALDRVAALLLRETGIRIDRSQYTSLRLALARADPGGDAESFLHAAEDPIWGRETIARLVDAVTIKETFFVREPRQLDAIPWRVLLERARAAGSHDVRVWSAACATGEEAYTLAMLASEALGADDAAGERSRYRHLDVRARGRAGRAIPRALGARRRAGAATALLRRGRRRARRR